jgi:hypothetical protein
LVRTQHESQSRKDFKKKEKNQMKHICVTNYVLLTRFQRHKPFAEYP